MNMVERKAFKMRKIKLLKDGGIEYSATITVNVDGDVYEVERSDKVPIIPAPSLENAIRDLKEKLLTTCNYLKILTVMKVPPFNAKQVQKDAINKMVDLIMDSTTVTGVSVSGQDQNEGVIISGKQKADNGSNVAINSPRMRFTSHTFGFEEDLEAEVDHIEDELYAYLFEGKKAQLSAFTDQEQKGPKEGELPLEDGSEA